MAIVYLLLKFGISGLMYLSICLSGGRTGDASDSVGLWRPNSLAPEQSSVYLKTINFHVKYKCFVYYVHCICTYGMEDFSKCDLLNSNSSYCCWFGLEKKIKYHQ